jgi:Family of unknown function (DUF5946)
MTGPSDTTRPDVRPGDGRCPLCGALPRDGHSCRDAFDALLAYEYVHSEAFGAVHHLTVAAWSLQHADGYRPEVLEAWRSIIADALDGRVGVADPRLRLGARFAGAVRVRDASARPPAWWPVEWPLSALDTLTPDEMSLDPATYIARARAWAGAVRTTLDAAATGEFAARRGDR